MRTHTTRLIDAMKEIISCREKHDWKGLIQRVHDMEDSEMYLNNDMYISNCTKGVRTVWMGLMTEDNMDEKGV